MYWNVLGPLLRIFYQSKIYKKNESAIYKAFGTNLEQSKPRIAKNKTVCFPR